MSKKRFEKLTKESESAITEVIKEDKKEKKTEKEVDSIIQNLDKKIQESIIPIPKSTRNKILEEVEKEARDTTNNKKNRNISGSIGDFRIDKFADFQEKNPNMPIDEALDSLDYKKNFKNRFVYNRVKLLSSVVKNEDEREKFFVDSLSYGSISLFIFLPLFTLFLRFIYIRRKFNYVDHLIFVFHTQTVFFMLLCMLYIISFFTNVGSKWIFILLFLIYLFIAMKKFYGQGYFKTTLKFLMLNFIYLLMGAIGVTIVGLISFALY